MSNKQKELKFKVVMMRNDNTVNKIVVYEMLNEPEQLVIYFEKQCGICECNQCFTLRADEYDQFIKDREREGWNVMRIERVEQEYNFNFDKLKCD